MDSAKGTAKQLNDLSKIYMEAVYGGGKKEEKKDTRLVVTAADKKANTPAYKNFKAGHKGYKAADHMKEGHSSDTKGKKNCGCGQDPCITYGKQEKVAEGKAESPEAQEEKDKKDDNLAGAPNKKGKKKAKRWWDDDGDGKGYEEGEVDGKFPNKKKVKEEVAPRTQKGAMAYDGPNKERSEAADRVAAKKKKGHDCASKVKHEEYGFGNCIKEMHTLDEDGNVSHYDVLFGSKLVKNVPADSLKIIEGMYHEHAINHEKNMELEEQQKDTPDQVAAVIDMYRSKKGTGEAVKDTEEGKKKAAKKERDYAAWERSKMKKDDPDWKHKKGSTTESKEAEEYLDTISDVKDAELKADIKRWSAIEESGKFTKEEIESLKEAERKLGDRLHRKRKLYDRTVTKAMDYASREGEAAGHARYRMGQLDREMDKVKDKMKEKDKK